MFLPIVISSVQKDLDPNPILITLSATPQAVAPITTALLEVDAVAPTAFETKVCVLTTIIGEEAPAPVAPAGPVAPLIPEVPEVPEVPEEPEEPTFPSTPDVPEDPEEPDVPEEPSVPDVPEEPEEPTFQIGRASCRERV